MNSTTSTFPEMRVDEFDVHPHINKGSYGVVYKITKLDSDKEYALKRNVASSPTHGVATLREIDILTRVSGHPLIVDLKGIIHSNLDKKELDKNKAFNKKDIYNNFSSGSLDDKIHFVFKLEDGNLYEDILESKGELDFAKIKYIVVQTLLALEWMHHRGVVHRDIKPQNILVTYDDQSRPRIKICDFGLSGIIAGCSNKTKDLVTNIYRPPEICFGLDYTEKVDVWSTGAVFYEIIMGRALLEDFLSRRRNKNESSLREENSGNEKIVATLLKILPELANHYTIKKFIREWLFDESEPINDFVDRVYKLLDKKTSEKVVVSFDISKEKRHALVIERLRKQFRFNKKEIEEFNDALGGGNYSDFCDLIAKMLAFDPNDRPTASECLNHKFIREMNIFPEINKMRRSFISNITSVVPGMPANISNHQIIIQTNSTRHCEALRTLNIGIWNNRDKIKWYNHRILFHTFDTYERYLNIRYGPRSGEDVTVALCESDLNEIYLQIYTILYMYYKYFTTLDAFMEWESFAPKKYRDEKSRKQSEEFEIEILKDVCGYQIFRTSLYETFFSVDGGVIKESRVWRSLTGLSKLKPEGGVWMGNVMDLFNEVMAITSYP